MSGYDVPAVLQ